MRDTGLMNGRLVPFCIGRLDSLAVGDCFISSSRTACMEGCGTGRGAGEQSAGDSICSEAAVIEMEA